MTAEDERKAREVAAEQLKRSNAEADARQHKEALAAAIAHQAKAPQIEKRRRGQQIVVPGSDPDPFE